MAADIPAAAVRTFDGLLAVFGVGEEDVEALIAVVADKVIGGHAPILTESGSGVERGLLHYQPGDTIIAS